MFVYGHTFVDVDETRGFEATNQERRGVLCRQAQPSSGVLQQVAKDLQEYDGER